MSLSFSSRLVNDLPDRHTTLRGSIEDNNIRLAMHYASSSIT
ncbi:MAG: hypothetical protein SWZ49_03560 [Cyanobacteriota bacterium]|nr:hypothetical protein [Cyanobacteriota bacterium]